MKEFARATKLTNISGRADYISNPDRQEKIVATSETVDWQPYHLYEREKQKSIGNRSIEGLEVTVALPNEWRLLPLAELKVRAQALAETAAGKKTDLQWAIHWNRNHTNLHMHVIFSERQKEKVKGRWDRDIYLTSEGKVARSKSERAKNPDGSFKPPVHRKGDIKGGFTSKDTRYGHPLWFSEVKEDLKETFKKFGVELEKLPPLHEFHEGKGKEAPKIHVKNLVIRENNERLLTLVKAGSKIENATATLISQLKKHLTPVFYVQNHSMQMKVFKDPHQALDFMVHTRELFAEEMKPFNLSERPAQHTEPSKPAHVEPAPVPSFDRLITADANVEKCRKAVLKAKEAIGIEREINYTLINLPEKLHTATAQIKSLVSGISEMEKEMLRTFCPEEPKGIFVTKKKKEQYEKDYEAYRAKMDPLRTALAKNKKELQESLDFVMKYLRPEERIRQGYGYDAPLMAADNVDVHDAGHIERAINFKLDHFRDVGAEIADEVSYANKANELETAKNALEASQGRYEELLKEIPQEHLEAAQKAVEAAREERAKALAMAPAFTHAEKPHEHQQKHKSDRDDR